MSYRDYFSFVCCFSYTPDRLSGKNGGEFEMYFRAAYTNFIHSGLLDKSSVRLIIK